MRFAPRRHWPVLACLGIVLQLSCDNPVCACPPSRTHAVAFGTVRTAAGAPVQGARVKAAVFDSQCGEGFREDDEIPGVTGATGAYELRFFSVHSSGTRCVRFVASRGAAGSDSVVVERTVEMRHERDDPVRVRVDLVFP
jgi:hypothetical protein